MRGLALAVLASGLASCATPGSMRQEPETLEAYCAKPENAPKPACRTLPGGTR